MGRLVGKSYYLFYGLTLPLLAFGAFISAARVDLILAMVGIFSLVIGFGLQIADHPLGLLRDGQNGYSLSRLQMALWSWLILSGLIVISTARVRSGPAAEALNIYIPQDLFIVMGISFFSGAAAPALLSLKAQAPSTGGQLQTARQRMSETAIVANGQLVVRQTSAAPAFADIVEGDDLATAGTVDLSKVQQLLITLLLVLAYFSMLWSMFGGDPPFTMSESLRNDLVANGTLLCGYSNPANLAAAVKAGATPCGKGWTGMPDFPVSMVTLLAVSHGGYLAFKAAPRAAADNSSVQPPGALGAPLAPGAPMPDSAAAAG